MSIVHVKTTFSCAPPPISHLPAIPHHSQNLFGSGGAGVDSGGGLRRMGGRAVRIRAADSGEG